MNKSGSERFREKYRNIFLDLESKVNEEFESKKNEFKEFYSSHYDALTAACDSYRNLVHLLLSDSTISTPKVISRVKDRDGCIKKFELKYRNEAEKSGLDYKIQDFITDMIGVRIVCLYETDITVVENLIRSQFDVFETTDKTKILTSDNSKFGYKGLHMDARLNSKRAKLPEYSRFNDLRFEIQVRSIVQDAWSEVDHQLKYKRRTPDSLQRRITRLAALFELADQEFVSIRDETETLEKHAVGEISDHGENADNPINAFSFLSIMSRRFPKYPFFAKAIDGFVEEISKMDPDLTERELERTISENFEIVNKYKEERALLGMRPNPFTMIRLILYKNDPNLFSDLLYPDQKAAFRAWLEAEETPIGEA